MGRMLSGGVIICLTGILAGIMTAQAASFDCVIDPSQKVKLASSVPGLLTNVLVKRGDFVRRNDVVAQLDSALEEATVKVETLKAGSNEEIEAQQTRLILSRNRYERAKSLAAKEYGTLDRLEQMDSELKVGERELALMRQRKQLAELELARSKTALERRAIMAPMDGFVLERTMGPGEFIHQEVSIGTLASLDPLHVETFVPVAYWSILKEGHRAMVNLAPPINERRMAIVSVIDRVFDIASGTFGVRLELPNRDFILPAGQRCTVDFEFNPK
jgi:RND family efflux transporter MFP subunit